MTSVVKFLNNNPENYQSEQSSFLNESNQGTDEFRSSNTPARQVVNVFRTSKRMRNDCKRQSGIAIYGNQQLNLERSKTPKKLRKALLKRNELIRLKQSKKVQGSMKVANKPMKQVSIQTKQQKDAPINAYEADQHYRINTSKTTSSNQVNLLSKTKMNHDIACNQGQNIPDQYIQEDVEANRKIKELNDHKQQIRNGFKNQSQLTKVLQKILNSNEDLKVEIKQLKSKYFQNNQFFKLPNRVQDPLDEIKNKFNEQLKSLKRELTLLLTNQCQKLNQSQNSLSTQIFGSLDNFKQFYVQQFKKFLPEVKTSITNQISNVNIKLDQLISKEDENSRQRQLLLENKLKEIQQFNRSQMQKITSYLQQISLMKISLESIQKITKNQQELIKENGQNQRKSSQKVKIMLTNSISANFIKTEQTNRKFLFLNKCLSKSINKMSKNYKRQMSKLHTVFQQSQRIYENLFNFIDSQHPTTTEKILSTMTSEMHKNQKKTQKLLLQNKLSTQQYIKENNNKNHLIIAKQCVAHQDLIKKSLQKKSNETNTYLANYLWSMETRIFNNVRTQTNFISQSAQQILLETKSILSIKTKDLSDQIRGLSVSFNQLTNSNERFFQKNQTYLINVQESFRKYEDKVSKKIAFLGKGLVEYQNSSKSFSRKSENRTKNIISAIHHLKRHMKSHINSSKEHFMSRTIEKISLSNELLLKNQSQNNLQCMSTTIISLLKQFQKIKQERFMYSQIHKPFQKQDNYSDSLLKDLINQINLSKTGKDISVTDQSKMELGQWKNILNRTNIKSNYQIIKKTQDVRPFLDGFNNLLEALDDNKKEKEGVKPNDSSQSNREEFDQSFQNSEMKEVNQQKSHSNSKIGTNKKASGKMTYKSEDYSLMKSQCAQPKRLMQAIIQFKMSFSYMKQLLQIINDALPQDRRRQKDRKRSNSVDLDSSIKNKLKRGTENDEQVDDQSQYIELQQILGVIAQYHSIVDGPFAKLIQKYPKKVNKFYLSRSSINP